MGMGWKYFFLKKHVWLGHPNGQPLSHTMAFAQLGPSLEWSWMQLDEDSLKIRLLKKFVLKCEMLDNFVFKNQAQGNFARSLCLKRHSSHSILHEIVTVNGTTAVSNTAQHVWIYA